MNHSIKQNELKIVKTGKQGSVVKRCKGPGTEVWVYEWDFKGDEQVKYEVLKAELIDVSDGNSVKSGVIKNSTAVIMDRERVFDKKSLAVRTLIGEIKSFQKANSEYITSLLRKSEMCKEAISKLEEEETHVGDEDILSD